MADDEQVAAPASKLPRDTDHVIKELGRKRAYIRRTLTIAETQVENWARLTDAINRINFLLTEYYSYEEEHFEPDFENYYPVVSAELERLDVLKRMLVTTQDVHAPTPTPTEGEKMKVKLPTISLPTFAGDCREWYSFKEQFLSVIDSVPTLSELQKMQYLKSAVKGDAAALLTPLATVAANYSVALDLLRRTFENKRVIHQCHIEELLFATPKIIKEDASSYRRLINHVRQHLAALKTMGRPVDQWDDVCVQLIRKQLPRSVRLEWENSVGEDHISTLDDMQTFLIKRCHALELSTENEKRTNEVLSRKVAAVHLIRCNFCNEDHSVINCPNLMKLEVNERINVIRDRKLCHNCIRPGHKVADCPSTNACKRCNKRHHTLLHMTKEANQTLSAKRSAWEGEVLLSTCLVQIRDSRKNKHCVRMLLDSGSQINIITSSLVSRLKLKPIVSPIAITGIGHKKATCDSYAEVTIKSRIHERSLDAQFFIMDKITTITPAKVINIDLNLPENVNLADPTFNKPGHIDLLLGAEHFYKVLNSERIEIGKISLQNTLFGWVVSGCAPLKVSKSRSCNTVSLNQLNTQIERFWKLETVVEDIKQHPDDKYVEEHFKTTTTRDDKGRFIVRLPWRSKPETIGSNYDIAFKRFLNLEKRFKLNQRFWDEYTNFMNTYRELGHMQRVVLSPNEAQESYFLPHHGVFRESSSTTKLRVVFNASEKSNNGLSLNDALLPGPNLQKNLIDILIRFRSHQYVLTADIKMMYRQIGTNAQDNKYQRILWRSQSDDPIEYYELTTVTYGTSCAPFLAMRCLRALASHVEFSTKPKNRVNASRVHNNENIPLNEESSTEVLDVSRAVDKVILNDFYMDDLLTGASSIRELRLIRNEINRRLGLASFELRKWASNEAELLQELNSSSIDSNADKHIFADEGSKTLGLSWNAKSDSFQFRVPCQNLDIAITKRHVLSSIAQFFDPLGILCPIIVKAKILMQQIWSLKLDWDERLPDELLEQWVRLAKEINNGDVIIVPRKVVYSADSKVELHVFGDASMKAYGAVAYVVSVNDHELLHSELLCSKSRVAPLRAITLPRLELCAAVLAAQLAQKIVKTDSYSFENIYYYTDSTIVLAWVNSPSTSYKPFVSHRVGEIHNLSEPRQWRHVASERNPADIASRGAYPSELQNNEFWFRGPSSVFSSQNARLPDLNDSDYATELRVTLTTAEHSKERFPIEIKDYSKYTKLLRVIARVKRFVNNCRGSRLNGEVSPVEIEEAERCVVRHEQYQYFSDDIKALKRSKHVAKQSRLLPLNPFLDEHGLLRVGGRLRHSNLEYDAKFPVLVPSHSHLASLLIKQSHEIALHSGLQGTIAQLRTKFWLLSARTNVRRELRKCIKCFKFKPTPIQPLMGDLPRYRAAEVRAFARVGVDFCGPLQLREGRRRNSKLVKVYVAAFVCMCTRAVHLELVGDLSTDAFIASLRRFIGRRGYPSDLYSDNGTNFVGADHELRSFVEMLNTDERLKNIVSCDRIKWHFIPPSAPHFGGLWEAVVKRTKYHLRRVAAEAHLTWEELTTLLCQIEAVLNSRPLAPLTNDPSDLSYLTPGHFLIGTYLNALPTPDLRHIKLHRLSRWQHLQTMQQHFWDRWSKEYLQELQVRSKWKQPHGPILREGQLVLIRDDHQPSNLWTTGRVELLHPGDDGVTRAATVRTIKGSFKRPAVKLYPFPEEEEV